MNRFAEALAIILIVIYIVALAWVIGHDVVWAGIKWLIK